MTLALNSRAGWRAFYSLACKGNQLDLSRFPGKPLELSTPAERRFLAEQIAIMTEWDGFGASLATKVLHKKRPALIPVMDNQAIFGAYMNPDWPQQPPGSDTVKDLDHRHGARVDRLRCDAPRKRRRVGRLASHTTEAYTHRVV